MRLTLRTLLAYLDDILEPSQTRELGEKISESGFAEQLISRIRDVMRRRRLSAPALSGPGSGIDPNAVGEYLDNTLAPEKIADVEKVCLESDVHLAEVAACHQILTLVLHEPVEVPPDSRARLYALAPDGGQSAPPRAAAASANDAPVLDRPSKVTGVKALDTAPAEITFNAPAENLLSVTGQQAPPHSDVPEYMRDPPATRRWLPYAVVAAVAVIWVLLMFHESIFPRSDSVPGPGTGAKSPEPRDVGAIQPRDNASNPEEVKKDEVGAESKKPPVPADKKIGTPAVAKVEPQPAKTDQKSGIKITDDIVSAGTTGVPKSPEKAAAVPENPPKKDSKTVVVTTPPERATLPATPPVATPPELPEPAVVKYTPTNGVMLYLDKKRAGWLALPKSKLYPEDQLAVPEPCEGALEVNDAAFTVSLRGGSRVRLLPPLATANFGLDVHRGRIVIKRDIEGEKAPALLVKIRDSVWRLELLMPGTLCAIEAVPILAERFEQDLGDRTVAAVLHVASGSVRISRQGANGEPVTIVDRSTQKLTQDALPEGDFPTWVAPFTASVNERSRIAAFAAQFEGNKKSGQDEIAEVSMLAAAAIARFDRPATDCLGLIGAYDALVAILQRTQHDRARDSAIEGLRIWLPQRLENRALLKQQLDKSFSPADAQSVYELLWGYTADDLRSPQKSRNLIELMRSNEVAIRELAYQNAFRLTKKRFEFRASSPPNARKIAIDLWEEYMRLPKNKGALLPPAPAP